MLGHAVVHILCDTDESISNLFVLLSVLFLVMLGGCTVCLYAIRSDVVVQG